MRHLRLRHVVSLILTSALANFSWAEPGEIKVYTDDINSLGETSLELHGYWVQPAKNAAPNQASVFNVITEFAYGFRTHWDAGLQLPFTYVNGAWHGTGLRAEVQYIAEHDETSGAYWGGRGELGYATPVDSPQYWSIELRPVLGYRVDRWHFVVNPAVSMSLTGSDQQARFEPSAKLAYQLNANNAIGIEYYLEAGPITKFLPKEAQSETVYLIWDTRIGKTDLNMGLGVGTTDASAQQVVKLIAAFPL